MWLLKRHRRSIAACVSALSVIVLPGGCGRVTEPLPVSEQTPIDSQVADLGPVPDGVFMTDATGYLAHQITAIGTLTRYRFTVVTRYANRGTTTLYLGRCFPTSPQPLFTVVSADLSGTSGYEYAWACTGHDKQFALAPGATRVDTLQVEGPNMWDGRTHSPLGVTSGRFKLFFDVRTAAGDGAPYASRSLGYSNDFLVRAVD